MISLPSHGVLIEINGIGVFLIGDSGIGKSEIALQLIYQGACLICDDAPELVIDTENKYVSGHCPKAFYGMMHIHDLGIINLVELANNDLFQASSFQPSHTIDFIIQLIVPEDRESILSQQTPEQLLTPDYQYWQHHNWTIPGIHLHLYPNRNMPLIIKTAVLQFLSSKKINTQPIAMDSKK